MKKAFGTITVLILCALLTGCQKEEPPCTHQFATTVTQEATCLQTGVQAHTCQTCGLTVTQTMPAADHIFTESVAKEPSCSEEGIRSRQCTVCGVSEETPIAPVAHTFNFYSPEPSRCTVCSETVAGAAADPQNPWYGRKWLALGTSLSSETQGTYVAPLAERSGMTAVSMGIPGGTATSQILKQIQTADLSQADLITIEFGVNDWFEGIPLGKTGDTVPYLAQIDEWSNGGTEAGTFAGACHQIFTTLQKRAPQAVIVFLTDSSGQTTDQEDCSREKGNSLGLKQWDYTDMAVRTARYSGIPVIEAGSMINQEHPQFLADQIHHSELGGKQYALAVWMQLKEIPPLLKAE